MNRAERHRRARAIARRRFIAKHVQRWSPRDPGRLGKWNLTCSCSACKRQRYDRTRARREAYRDLDALIGRSI